MKQQRHIRSNKERDEFISKLSKFNFVERPFTFTIEPYKDNQTRDQQNKYHAQIRDISNQVDFCGTKRSVDDWKVILMSAFRKDQGMYNMAVYPGLRGEAVSLSGLSTHKLKASESSDFIEWIYAEFPGVDWTV